MALTSSDETDLLIPLFDALAEERPFAAFLERLQRRTGAEYLCITARIGETVSEHFIGPDMRRRAHALGELEFNVLDRINYDRLRPGRVYSAEEFVPDDPALRVRRKAHMNALGMADERVVRVLADEGASAWLIMARTNDCTAADSALLSNLAPYVGRTLRTLLLIERKQLVAQLSVDGLERGGAGWIAFGADGRVVAVPDDTAETLCDLGISLQAGQRLRGLGASLEHQLFEAAADFARDRSAPARTLRLRDDPRVEALVAPAASTAGTTLAAPVMIAHLRLPRPPSPDRAKQLAALCGLTRREAELAVGLADGLSLSEVGEQLGLTIETTRNYSKRLYAKLGVRGQAGVVRLVGESAAALA